jgi:hypothetical protein
MKSTTSKTINLIEIANQIALTAKGLQKKVSETEQPLNVSASLLVGKIPELKAITNKNIVRLSKTLDGCTGSTCNTWVNDEGEVIFCYTDLQPMEGFTPIRHKPGIGGWVDLQHESGFIIKINISVSESFLEELEISEDEPTEKNGSPLPSQLKLIPQPETPLHDNKLPQGVEFEIISNGKYSRKFNTPLVNIRSENGEVFNDVICNYALQKIYETHGTGAKFKIANKRPKRNKQGEPVTANGEVSKTNHAWIVNLIDCQIVDFSDL